ncbi:uncharacterized protein LOC130976578 isoform X4 [Arachis stenosperma]|nr:uncharacterized protein LOC130976578 isoform X4 [Arachis stenosperma]
MARTVWNKTMHDRYPNILKRARDRAFKEANSTSIADIKGHGPKAMKVDVWNGLVDHWLDSKWQNKSVAGQKNRAAMPTHKLHTAGSISFGEHKRRKEAKLKRRVSFLEVYDDVHKKKSGEYVSKVSKEIIHRFSTMAHAYQNMLLAMCVESRANVELPLPASDQDPQTNKG